MFTINRRVVINIGKHGPISSKHAYLWCAPWTSPNHIPIKYRGPNKQTSHLRATSHTRLRARDCYASSTLIGGKGRAGPGSLHTTLEGPTEYVNARWM